MSEDNPFDPPQVPVDFKPSDLLSTSDLNEYKADRASRWLGRFLDTLAAMVIGAPMAIAGVVAVDDPELAGSMVQMGLFGGYLVLAPVNWYLIVTRGQTLGKMAVGTRIVDQHGGPVDFVQGVVLRSWLVGVATACVPFAGLIDSLFIFGDDVQCGHDKLAKTIVVRSSTWNPYQ